jgi:ATP:ADP antiporter, AAA family
VLIPHTPVRVAQTAATRERRAETVQLVTMAALFFIVQCAVGVLRPIKNALALDGLGATDFYRVYLVSSAVVLFVPLYTRMVERIAWRRLVPGMAIFFALNLLVFRVVYREGSTLYGMVFYGWYDLLSAALISQYFLAAQYIVDARSAKRAYPLLIAGGSFGAATGGAITGFLTGTIGTPNLLLAAAVFILAFGLLLPLVIRTSEPVEEPRRRPPARPEPRKGMSGVREVMSDPHVRLIAFMVLVTIVVKQIVDYQFNALTQQTFGTPAAVSAFQGKFIVATQLLPLGVLILLNPLLRRFGVAVAVLLLPAAMLFASLGLAVFWSLGAGVFAKATETTLRYSAERTGREILYVPVPASIKMRAKTYIDVALEEGIGKAVAALIIFVLLLGLDQKGIAIVGAVLSAIWLALGVAVRREYVQTLARAIEGRFASVRGLSTSLADATTWPVVKRAIESEDPLRVAFALDLIEESPTADIETFAPAVGQLLDHPAAEIRVRALGIAERFPGNADASAIRARLRDASSLVREAAVRALCADASNPASLDELLSSEEYDVRTAALACIARGEVSESGIEVVRRHYRLDEWATAAASVESRTELALAAGTLGGDPHAEDIVARLLDDGDPGVATTALVAAGRLCLVSTHPKLIAALGRGDTREAARSALAAMGDSAVRPVSRALLDPRTDPVVRRVLPSVLARIPCEATIIAMLRAIIAPETEQLLDYRTIKLLSKLRARQPDLPFDTRLVLDIVKRETAVAQHHATAHAALSRAASDDPVIGLARGAFADAWRERREGAFRCLGLILPAEGMYRCYLALSGEVRARANALEWLEQTVGYSLFHQLAPILRPDIGGDEAASRSVEALAALFTDSDAWVAECAAAAARALGHDVPVPAREESHMSLIETVFLLQRVDLLKDARGAHLALLATIAEDVTVERDEILIHEGESTDALYVIRRGVVELRGVGGRLTITDGGAFGTWALIDEAPSPVQATAVEPTEVLRIRREEFHDLVADHPELAIGLLQGLARRIRTLVA